MEELIKAFYRALFNWLEGRNRHAFRVLRLLESIFKACTPAFAAPYQIAETGKLLTPLSGAIFGAAFVHCFVLTAGMSLVSGTFWKVPGCSLEFTEDICNIILYVIVCPAYVTLCIRLVLLSMGRDPHNLQPLTNTTPGQTRRVFLCLFSIYVLSSILITSYVNDALNPEVVKPAYWFVESTTDIRRLNAAGLYYIVLNFALLFLTFLGGAAFISISIDGIHLSRELLDSGIPIEFDHYALRVERLLVAYFFGTLLVACYAINIFIWQRSELGSTSNIRIAAAILTILGVFFVAIPKQYIDHVWARYVARRDADHAQRGMTPNSVELPYGWGTRTLLAANVAWIFTWAGSYYGVGDYLELPFWLDRALTQEAQPEPSKHAGTDFSACGNPPRSSDTPALPTTRHPATAPRQ